MRVLLGVLTAVAMAMACHTKIEYRDRTQTSVIVRAAYDNMQSGEVEGSLKAVFTSAKYNVASIKSETTGAYIIAIVSVEGSVDDGDLAAALDAVKSNFSGIEVSSGPKAREVCEGRMNPILTTQNTPTQTPQGPTQTPSPTPPEPQYCGGKVRRDIVLLIDAHSASDKTDKRAPLKTFINNVANRLPMTGDDEGSRVQLVALTSKGGDVVGDWVNTASGLQAAWSTFDATYFKTASLSLNTESALQTIKTLKYRGNAPVEVVVVVDHDPHIVSTDLRSLGVYVAPYAVSASIDVSAFINPIGSQPVQTFSSYVAFAQNDVLQKAACEYFPPAPAALSPNLAAVPDNLCQNLDLIFVIDTSQSIHNSEDRMFDQAAIHIVSKFNLNRAQSDFTRTAIITFEEKATVIANLNDITTIDDFKKKVNGIQSTDGLTSIASGLSAAMAEWQARGSAEKHRVVVLFTDGESTATSDMEMAAIAAKDLIASGAEIFIAGDGKGFADSFKALTSLTVASNIFNSTAAASAAIPPAVLQQFSCPATPCTSVLFAVELTELSDEYNGSEDRDGRNKDILKIISNLLDTMAAQATNTTYRMLAYSDPSHTHWLPQSEDDLSPKALQGEIQKLLNNDDYYRSVLAGYTYMGNAAKELKAQIDRSRTLQSHFQGTVLMIGQADKEKINDAVDVNADFTALFQSVPAKNFYSVDETLFAPTQTDHTDLWTGLGLVNAPIPWSDAATVEAAIRKSSFLHTTASLTCQLETEWSCQNRMLDTVFVMEVSQQNNLQKIVDYTGKVIGQFPDPQLASHIGINDHKTVVASLISRPAPFPTNFLNHITASPVDDFADIVTSLKGSQFGCKSVDDTRDRQNAPNVIVVVTDNANGMSLANVKTMLSEWGADDCHGTPSIVLLNFGAAVPNESPLAQAIGRANVHNLVLGAKILDSNPDIEAFNQVIKNICNTSPMNCCICSGQCPSKTQSFLQFIRSRQ